jgi:hypothetical protein
MRHATDYINRVARPLRRRRGGQKTVIVEEAGGIRSVRERNRIARR